MNALDLTAAVLGISGLVHFSLRPAIISLLHRVGAFEALGSPRTYFYSDALPFRVIFLPRHTKRDTVLVTTYFLSWLSFLASVVGLLVLQFSGPQSA